mmetsp:Transcript_48778/g.115874  ORF Transcript_48778/g.115874 Transcript_48778/m.115874 type:complete len:275 (+) Transcript_48778:100-924(+)
MKDSVRTVWVSPDRVQVLVIMPWCPFLVVNVRHQLSGTLINPACLPEEYCHCQHNANHPVLSLTARSRNLWVPRKIHSRAQHPPRSPEPLLFDPRRLVRRGGVEQQVASPSHWLLSRSQPPQSSPGSKRADRTLQPHRHPHFVCGVLRPMLPDPALYPDGCYVPPQRRVPERSSDHCLEHAIIILSWQLCDVFELPHCPPRVIHLFSIVLDVLLLYFPVLHTTIFNLQPQRQGFFIMDVSSESILSERDFKVTIPHCGHASQTSDDDRLLFGTR